jgi:hypothetical protein
VSETDQASPFDFWAVVELFGRVRLGGKAAEETHLGQAMLRLDIPGPDGEMRTRWFGGGAIYSVSPCSEELARMVAAGVDPAPVKRWELPAPPRSAAEREELGELDDEDIDLYPGPVR